MQQWEIPIPREATLREALARARTQAFLRAKKRVHAFQEDVKMAQAVVVAQEKLAKEEVLLREGEGRLQAFQQEEVNGMARRSHPPSRAILQKIGSV